MASVNDSGVEALRLLKEVEPPSLLVPNSTVSETARAASKYLFSSLRPFSLKSPLDQLLVDGYDAEQIWHQIDLQSQPLLSTLRRRLNQLAKNPEEIAELKKVPSDVANKAEPKEQDQWGEEFDGFDEELDEADEDEDDFEETEGEGEEDDEDDEEEEKGEGGGIGDKFLKIDELNDYLQKEEDNYEKGEEGDQDSEADDDLEKAGEFEIDEDEDDNDEEDVEDVEAEAIYARYDDFFGGKKEKGSKRKEQLRSKREEQLFENKKEKGSKRKEQLLEKTEDFDVEDDMESDEQKTRTASTHEKQLEKIQSNIKLMEKANIEPKTWTMLGEVTAAKRPVNSALEVDLDFQHNVRPPPVITEDMNSSIEEMIKKRIIEGRFDDVQRAPKLSSKVPREVKELDDNKSKQGLAEIYEQEYVQKIDPTSAPLSANDKLKNQASILFKKISLKLDALSHFSNAPKPVIEDMSFQTNVPALAMEEIAPVAVSDAAMLAPEEVFDGKGDVKEEAELTQAERKRRRANKKRKFKAEAVKRSEKKAKSEKKPDNAISGQVNG
ncbi:M phase phosphoprotein 10-like isoform X1 [Vicia villosa]|uniref:M phase phosphoprotein 10-like isoform X1 n=1 Tax=Vicia villosa TaxID=3911 RepID=UPI00273C9CCB|nr:M phase phosphoprotein 10-like isoform X1 [Vicia villosa]